MRKENKIYCNSCGKRIVDTIGREMEEYIHIEKSGDILRKKTENATASICVNLVTIK